MIFHRLTITALFVHLFFIAISIPQVFAGSPLLIDDFKNGLRPEWQTKIFAGGTYYTPTIQDNIPCIRADSRGTASGLVYRIKFNAKDYPTLKWQWKVANIISKGDARTKEGDDYSARIYVVFPSMFFWNTKVLNYIWANHLPEGTTIRSSYNNNFAMIAVESGSDELGKWREYEVNIYEDYKKNFGMEPPTVGAVAIMTDTDNTGETASACYGTIRFLPAE